MKANDLIVFISIDLYFLYQNRVFNVLKRFSSVDLNKLHNKFIFGNYQFYFQVIP